MKSHILFVLFTLGCSGSTGTPGLPGSDGAPGPQGPAGISTMISDKFTCEDHIDIRNLKINYQAILLNNGTLFVSGMISDEEFSYPTFSAYSPQEPEWLTGPTSKMVFDVRYPVDAGFFIIELNRDTLVTTTTYDDRNSDQFRTWEFKPSACEHERFE